MRLMEKKHSHWVKVNKNNTMNISLINGSFDKQEAYDILSQMIHVKIKYHELKITNSHNVEDIKMREKRIKELQKSLQEIRQFIQSQAQKITMRCNLELLN